MNYHEFKRAKETFPIKTYKKEYQKLEAKRLDFVRQFSIKNLEKMKIDQFVIGKQNTDSFCYIIERTLDGLGRILGRPSNKFGVWYSPRKGKYSYDDRFGRNADVAFTNVKNNIIKLLQDAEDNNIKELIDNPIDSLFKGKILSTYFPDRFLNIFSVEHLDYYLRFLNLDSKDLIKSDAIRKREVLLEFKNSDVDMRQWSIIMFAVFLYRHYPKRPLKENEVAVKSKNKEIAFPTFDDKIKWVTYELELQETHKPVVSSKSSKHKSPDYEKDAREHKLLGDRGEYIVYCAEVNRLIDELKISQHKAEQKIDWKSKKGDDSCGYDILSKNIDGSDRYIEVKATQRSDGDTTFYYTENELQFARQNGVNYHIYMVYDILSKNPKIWDMGNPFYDDDTLELHPIKYRVNVKTKKDKSVKLNGEIR